MCVDFVRVYSFGWETLSLIFLLDFCIFLFCFYFGHGLYVNGAVNAIATVLISFVIPQA